MATLEEARRAARKFSNQFVPRRTRYRALLGDASGVVSGSRPGMSLVRLPGRAPFEVANYRVPPLYNLPVIVGYADEDSRNLEVLGLNQGVLRSYSAISGGMLTPHAPTHMFGHPGAMYEDVVYVQKRVIVPLLARPTHPASMQLTLYADYYPYGSGWKYFPGGTVDLTAYQPLVGYTFVYVTVYIEAATGAVGVASSAVYGIGTGGDAHDLIPEPPAGSIPVVAVYLTDSATGVDEDVLYDVRLIFNAVGGTTTPIYNDQEGDPTLVQAEVTAIDGTSAYPARRDHRHNLSLFGSGMPSGLRAAGLSGVSPWASREDHAHSAGIAALSTLNLVLDGGGEALTAGIKLDVVVDFDCAIQGWTLLADQTGSILIDLWVDDFASFPPTDADSITASNEPELSSAVSAQDNTLAGWLTTLLAGDVIRVNVDSAATVERVTLALKVTRT